MGIKSQAEIVKSVDVIGNKRITLETVMVFGDITVGKDYKTSDINSLIKKLYETNYFSNISVELINGRLSITVEENPIINLVIFNGEKAEKHKKKITELIVLKEKSSYMKNFVKSDVNIMKEYYSNLGFYFAKIDVEIEKIGNNRINLVYTIDKGTTARIAKIFFLGDKKVRDRRLRDIITSDEAKWWKFISRNVYLNQGRIELDKRLLKNYYKNIGYYEVQISSSNVEYTEGQGFVLNYIINAGPRYKFKKLFADISSSLDETAFLPLESEFNKVVGEYYSQSKLTSILEKIDKLSEQKELQFINHRAIETLDADGVEVKIQIFEGQKFTIERINIVGNSVTNDSVIRSELIVDEGDPYSALLLNKSINRLKGRNLFGKIDKKIEDGSSPDLKILEISVEEKATGEISAGAGVGTDGSSFMFAIKENNWLGRGVRLNSSITIGEEKVNGNLAVTNPNFNYTGNSVSGSLDLSTSDMSQTSGYKSQRSGFSLGTSFEQYEDIFFSGNIAATYEEIDVESNASASIKKMDGTFTNLDLTYGIINDKRNQVFKPTDGYRAHFSQTLPLVFDSSAIYNQLNLSKYHGFSEDLIGSIKFLARSIHGVNDEDVRLTKRLLSI